MSLLCKIGFHQVNRKEHFVNYNGKRRTVVSSRSAFCKRCDKKLYLVDKYGKKKRRK